MVATLGNLFDGIISSKTRIKLLMRFFFNPETRSYLRELASEFGVSTNSVREELNQLSKTNLLKSEKNGRQIYYMANTEHPLFPELKSMVGKVMGIDRVVEGTSWTTMQRARTRGSSISCWWETWTSTT